ncbi:MAG: hypothetical protein PW788_10695 [Micavibrio sp.]|nr:hypothetical protein [Micavibrio sp.]
MQPLRKTFAQFTNRSWDVRERNVEIKSEQDAVDHALKTGSIVFNTYDVATVMAGGQELKGAPENFSARRYVGVDKIYTRDQVIKEMEDEKVQTLSSSWAAAIDSVIQIYKQKPADSLHITGLERPGEFIGLEDGEKVFDRKGQQIFPSAKFKP